MITKQSSQEPTNMPSHPWMLAFISQLALVFLAFIFQISGKHLILLPPWNWIVLVLLVVGAAMQGMLFARVPWVRWMASAPFAVTIIIVVAVMGAIGTFIVQDPSIVGMSTRLGLRSLFVNPPFAVAILLMLINLSMATGRRLVLPRKGQFGFLLNHVGLILVIMGMFAGTAQFQRTTLHIHEGETLSQGTDTYGKTFELGGSVTLHKFEIDKYPPKLFAVEFSDTDNDQQFVSDTAWVSDNHDFSAFNMKIHVLSYFKTAFPDDKGGWTPVASHGLPAAYIQITRPDGKQQNAWVVAGIDTLGIQSITATIDKTHIVGLLEPEPKAYRSHLTVSTVGKKPGNYTLEVNKPVKVGQWQLYQNSYEISMGGRASIIEAIRDPALPVVYLGLIAMLFGAFIALWVNIGPRQDDSLVSLQTTEETE